MGKHYISNDLLTQRLKNRFAENFFVCFTFVDQALVIKIKFVDCLIEILWLLTGICILCKFTTVDLAHALKYSMTS